jgi:3-oxoacyl-[acyl-carrier-protein] synthase-3
MAEQTNAYITSIGSYLPGPAIGNEEIEHVLGFVDGKASRLKSRILKSNGIKTRHYALDREQQTTHQNSDMAALAAEDCLERIGFDRSKIDMLAVATTQGDLPLPGMASMVQAQVNLPPCEILSTHGVCSAGVMALKSGMNQLRLEEKKNVLICASELASRLLKRSRYEAASQAALDLEAEFLRWMLSDGSAAILLQPQPNERGLSLRVDWIEIMSFASDFDLCMSCGTADQTMWSYKQEEKLPEYSYALAAAPSPSFKDHSSPAAKIGLYDRKRSWQDYDTYADAEKDGALLIRQNLRILDNIVKVGVDGFLRLIQAGKIAANEVDHFVCHYSSHYFRGKILDLFKMCGCMIPEEKWFTNLYTKGNTGCASVFIALDELFWSGRLQPGQVIFCVVPESGRFTTSYIKMTVI